MILPINQNHITYQAQEKVRELVAPLAKLADVHYFCYRVQYRDNTFFSLLTHIDYFETWFTNPHRLCGFCCKQGWHHWDPTLPKYEISRKFDIDNGVCHLQHYKDRTEIFSFANNAENSKATDFYLNEQQTLKTFMHYFGRMAHEMIRKAANQRVDLKYVTTGQQAHHFVQKTEDMIIDKFYHDINQPFSTLTKGEMDCYKSLIKGYSIREISGMLNIASSTIDEHIANVKQKLGTSSKKELVKLACSSGLIEYHFQD